MPAWDYFYVTGAVNNLEPLEMRSKALGSVGWEMCGFAAADPTIGINQFCAVFKRQTAGLPPPEHTMASWNSDPTGRHVQRYWDGFRWTEHVVTADGAQDIDWPVP